MADSVEGDHTMPKHDDHVKVLDKKITELSDALAHLGKGTDLKELIKIIRFPGYTTPAEFAFTVAMLDSMQAQVASLGSQSEHLLAAGRLVVAGQ
jgi:hypothetical protein